MEIIYKFIIKKLYCLFISHPNILGGDISYCIEQYNNHPNNDLLYVIINDIFNNIENMSYLKLLNIPYMKIKPLLGMVNYKQRKFIMNICIYKNIIITYIVPEWSDEDMKFYFSLLRVVMVQSLIITGTLKKNTLFDFTFMKLQNFDVVVRSISISICYYFNIISLVDIPVSDHFINVFYNSLDSTRNLECITLINITTTTNASIELLSKKIYKLKRFIYTSIFII